jgi:hypothetical protein
MLSERIWGSAPAFLVGRRESPVWNDSPDIVFESAQITFSGNLKGGQSSGQLAVPSYLKPRIKSKSCQFFDVLVCAARKFAATTWCAAEGKLFPDPAERSLVDGLVVWRQGAACEGVVVRNPT